MKRRPSEELAWKVECGRPVSGRRKGHFIDRIFCGAALFGRSAFWEHGGFKRREETGTLPGFFDPRWVPY